MPMCGVRRCQGTTRVQSHGASRRGAGSERRALSSNTSCKANAIAMNPCQLIYLPACCLSFLNSFHWKYGFSRCKNQTENLRVKALSCPSVYYGFQRGILFLRLSPGKFQANMSPRIADSYSEILSDVAAVSCRIIHHSNLLHPF